MFYRAGFTADDWENDLFARAEMPFRKFCSYYFWMQIIKFIAINLWNIVMNSY